MMSSSLSLVFTALSVVISFSVCCPIGCTQLPNIKTYLINALQRPDSILQARVNVSTTKGLTFDPQRVSVAISEPESTASSQPNKCEGHFNFTSQSAGVETLCPWTYECDYNPRRVPAFMFHARCNSASPLGDPTRGYCDEVYYPVSYIQAESCDPLGDSNVTDWQLITSFISVSCNLRNSASS